MSYFEDFTVGDVRRFGRYEVTRDEVLDFARRYDPQPFHLDDDAAAATHFGRLAASGWHTASMMMAMTVEAMPKADSGGLGAAGIDELRWLKPVYPGDVLRLESEVIETTRSRTKPMGIVKSRVTVLNQHDEPVMTLKPIALFRRRNG